MKAFHPQIFLVSATAFGLLVFLSPVVSTLLLGNQVQLVFAVPLLGFAVGTLVFVVPSLRQVKFDLFWVLFLFALSVCLIFPALTFAQRELDQSLMELAKSTPGLNAINGFQHQGIRLLVMSILAIPFFLYGIYLIENFARAEDPRRVFRQEMAGAAFGTVVLSLTLEHGGFFATLLFLYLAVFVAAALAAKGIRRGMILAVVAAVVGFVLVAKKEWVQPQRDLNLVARDFKRQSKVELMGEAWTSFAKMQKLRVSKGTSEKWLLALGDGTGHASLPSSRDGEVDPVLLAEIAGRVKPEASTVAVLFAGAGADLFGLDKVYGGRAKLLGIELNPSVIAALETPLPANATLSRGEAREFLSRDPRSFDVLIYSWSGATVAHYSGAIMHTTQYSFTREAFAQATAKVNPGGFLIVAGGGKINILASLKRLAQDGKIPQLEKSIVILADPSLLEQQATASWDNMVLVWKNGEITKAEIERLEALRASKYEVVDSPFNTRLAMARDLIHFSSKTDPLPDWRHRYGFFFNDYTDDRPFVYRSTAPLNFWSADFWRQGLPWGPMILWWLAVLVSVLLLFSKKKTWRLDFAAWSCGCVGAALQILVLFRFLLLIGNPTLALWICVGGGFVGSWLGSMAPRIFTRQPMWWWIVGAGGVGLALLLNRLPRELLLAAFFAMSVIWGTYFPYVLTRAKSLGPAVFYRICAMDAWGAVAATALMPLVLENMGFLFAQKLIGLGFFVATLLIL